MGLSVRARLTLLVGGISAIVLVLAAVLGPGRIEQSLIDEVLDDAAVEQLVVFGEIVFGGEPIPDEFFIEERDLSELALDEVFVESELLEADAALRQLEHAGVLDDLLREVRSDRATGVPVVLTNGHVAIVSLEADPRMLEVDPGELDSPIVTFFTLVETGFLASGPDAFDEIVLGIDDELSNVEIDASEPSMAFGVRDLGGIDFVVGTEVSDVERSVDRIRSLLWTATPVVVIGAVLVTWLLTGRALRPVARITDQVAEISAGTLHERVPQPGTGDEIEELAGTMNAMLDRLEVDDRRLRQFVSDASHELRTPVAVLRSEAEVALRRPDDTMVD